jgi:hypothetical protein
MAERALPAAMIMGTMNGAALTAAQSGLTAPLPAATIWARIAPAAQPLLQVALQPQPVLQPQQGALSVAPTVGGAPQLPLITTAVAPGPAERQARPRLRAVSRAHRHGGSRASQPCRLPPARSYIGSVAATDSQDLRSGVVGKVLSVC